MRYNSNLYQEERCHPSSLFLVIRVAPSPVTPVLLFLSSQCSFFCHPSAPFLSSQ
ncbi:hypothetical protein [Wolbachia endosymbiont (group A) of Pogonocherus hispidulus]|uniref:hypothetical protein n=1 Tax=Wolbachia endosymbiont (group A) of Pogonocherus hispidulus TaxID=3066136 RepID=UPI0033400839